MPKGIYNRQNIQIKKIPLEKRFWEKVDKSKDCWLWKGAIHKKTGYGVFQFEYKKTINAHRVAWFLIHGYFSNLGVCHKCDNKICVNPNHLFEGTQKENIHDAMRKKRFISAIKKKFTEKQAIEIIKKYKTGLYTHSDLGKEYNLSRPVIGKIITHKRSDFYITT